MFCLDDETLIFAFSMSITPLVVEFATQINGGVLVLPRFRKFTVNDLEENEL